MNSRPFVETAIVLTRTRRRPLTPEEVERAGVRELVKAPRAKHAVQGRNGANPRNGARAKTVLTDNAGPVQVEVPATVRAASSRSSSRRGSGAC